jgi:release factor glutamine methyltransferase
MKIKDVLEKTTTFFKDKKIASARLDAEILISFGLNLKRIDLYINHDQPLKEIELEDLRTLVKRRGMGEPVAYIIGEKEFFGLPFKVNADVLIPRPETEHLVEKALEWIHKKSFDHPVRVLDLGCGSGCLGLSIAAKTKNTIVSLLDVSEKALFVTQNNVHLHLLNERVELIKSTASDIQWMDESSRKFKHKLFDIIISNPPYIDRADPETEAFVRKFEPEIALFAEGNGYSFLKSWSEIYEKFLSSEAMMAMEIGYKQGTEMYDHFKMLGCFHDVQIIQDLANHDRIVFGAKYG